MMTVYQSVVDQASPNGSSTESNSPSNIDIENQKKFTEPLIKPKHYKRKNQYFTYMKRLFLPLIFVGAVTGGVCGVIIGSYQCIAKYFTEFNLKLFSYVQKNLLLLPAAYAVNILIGLILGYAIQYLKEIRGSGIPYIESVARGNIDLTWYSSLPAMYVFSLIGIFSGLTIGSEGPSVFLGGCIGYGISKILKLNHLHYMLLVAAGSSAGLGIAFNAPLTGMIFALEEVYRKFSTQIILVSVFCVSISQLTCHALFAKHNMNVKPLITDVFGEQEFVISLLCGLAGGLLGSIFNVLIYRSRNLFKYIKFLPMKFYVILPEIIAVSLCTFFPPGAYGGYEVLQKLLNNEVKTWEMGAALAVRIAAILICFGSKTPGGIFIPMLSVGALLGGLVNKLALYIGYDSVHYTFVVLMTMSAFFTAVVRAPLTAVILPIELTMQYCGWLGPITAVSGAYIVAGIFRVEPLYERLMELLVVRKDEEDLNKFDEFSMIVSAESVLCNMTIREFILPEGTTITHIVRDNTLFFPCESSQIIEGDEVFLMCEIEQMSDVQEQMAKLF